jgi:hypothetical protein
LTAIRSHPRDRRGITNGMIFATLGTAPPVEHAISS